MNLNIRVPEVRCIDSDGTQVGVITTREAQGIANKRGLDLVEVSPNAKPPVCRIMDYGKYKYEQKKKQRKANSKASKTKLKEVKFHINVEQHDYDTKIRHARKFFEKGHRVKFSLFFRGRERAHKDLGFDLMNQVMEDLKDLAQVDQKPRMMGRSLIMQMSPDKDTK